MLLKGLWKAPCLFDTLYALVALMTKFHGLFIVVRSYCGFENSSSLGDLAGRRNSTVIFLLIGLQGKIMLLT